MAKPILSIDIDDVLAPSARAFVDFSNKKWGTHLNITDYNEDWSKIWQLEEGEELKNRVEAIDQADFYGGKCPHPEDKLSIEVLNRLKNKFKIVTLTSRRSVKKDGTIEWLEKHYPNIFDDYIFSGIYDSVILDRKEGSIVQAANRNKGQLLRDLHISWHIDDQPKHCIGASEHGINSILFGNYTWNKDTKLEKNMKRAISWLEIESILVDWLENNG
jgi:5'(3')-deoxyribonucleotidase